MSTRTLLTLANGRHVDLRNPRPEDVELDWIAEHLAKENRYNGATPGRCYSVAQHCVLGASDAAEAGDLVLARYFLLHDAAEAVLRDDTTPKKRALAEEAEVAFGVLADTVMGAFSALTDRHDAAIHTACGLDWPPPPGIVAAVHVLDKRMFVTEWRDLMGGIEHPDWSPYADLEPLAQPIVCWPWESARNALLGTAAAIGLAELPLAERTRRWAGRGVR